MRITVFLSSNPVPDRYRRAAEHLGRFIGEAGHTVVWGGTDLGLMKVLVDAVEEAGGKSEGISVGFLEQYTRPGAGDGHWPRTSPTGRSGFLPAQTRSWWSPAAPAHWTKPRTQSNYDVMA